MHIKYKLKIFIIKYLPFIGKKQREEKKLKWQIKTAFRTYFEGYYDPGTGYADDSVVIEPVAKTPTKINDLCITNLDFQISKKKVKFIITLQRPGRLIGKAGSTIDGVTAFIQEAIGRPFEIVIKETNLW